VLDETDPQNVWRRGAQAAMRFEVQAPLGPFELLNVHFETVRGGVEALAARGLSGLPQFVSNRATARRDSARASERVRVRSRPLIIAGDFNLPVESMIYRDDWSSFSNAFSRCGRGIGNTKFTGFYGSRIDHLLTSAEWHCTDARVLRTPYGGDHRPLVVDLRFLPADAAAGS
jgi:endonuclease/exonuclease/phosphatase (EEP) superfamily protein YafD